MDDTQLFDFDSPLNQSSYIKVIGVGGGGNNAVNHPIDIIDSAHHHVADFQRFQVLPGKLGEKWETIMKLNNNELTGFVPEKETNPPTERKDFVQESAIEFKNDYQNPKFIKGATIISIIVIILTTISKIILISSKHFKVGLSN